MVAWAKGGLVELRFEDIAGKMQLLSPQDQLVLTAEGMGICVGRETNFNALNRG